MLLSLGTCGSVSPELQVGQVLVAERVLYRGGAIETTGPLAEQLERRLAGRLAARTGTVETVDRPVFSRRGLDPAATGVEMEAYEVTAVASRYGIPALVVKVASDSLRSAPGPANFLRWISHWRAGFAQAKLTLDELARLYFDSVLPGTEGY
jgi:nucleoside phosphorylase